MKATGKRYVLKGWESWAQDDPALDMESDSLDELIEAAQSSTLPLVDLYERGADVPMLAVRRMVSPWRNDTAGEYRLRDDFRPGPVTVGGVPVFASKDCGSLIATKVEIASGAYAGRRGLIERIWHPGAVSVRLDGGPTLPFGPSELKLRGGAA